jgi:endonuclease YncB( thermonuclease family)
MISRACILTFVGVALVAGGACPSGSADEPGARLRARAVRIIDGDSVVFRVGGDELHVRLSEIDAPELSQPYGTAAKAALESLLGDRAVDIVVVDVDRYDRSVVDIYRGDVLLNHEMVRLGHAWAYTRYARTVAIIDREAEARAAQRGLWRLPSEDREPPWLWRKEGRRTSQRDAQEKRSISTRSPRSGEAPAFEIDCGTKRYCSEMASCAEARAYLERCGLGTIDGDRDGIPCETLCAPR